MEIGSKKHKKSVRLFTSECVSVGHPDKVCDYISDSILTEVLKNDKSARVAVETFAYTNGLVIAGEVSTTAEVNYEEVARRAIREIGYIHPGVGFDADSVKIEVHIDPQSPDIALGTNDKVGGAGDQGLMFGGAVNETSDDMPLPITIARAIIVALEQDINEHIDEEDPMLRPDAKSQVTLAYGRGNVPQYVDTVVVSCSHSENVPVEKVREYILANIVKPVLNEFGYNVDDVYNIYINPTGRFAKYGPAADVGLTGRKIIVDTYGGYFGHGGGAFSGKDPSKVDRSAAYMARYLAKNIVASGVADRVEIQLAYAIGVPQPVSINVNAYGTNKYPVGLIVKAIRSMCDLTPAGITEKLSLRSGKIDYAQLSVTGHFGEFGTQNLPWENTDLADSIKEYCENNYVEKVN